MQNFQIVTFNLRYLWDGDGINSFVHRGALILEKIREQMPDVICFQEAVDKNIEFLSRNLSDYYFMHAHRSANYTGEGVALAYRKERFNLFSLDAFWLSDTPLVAGSRIEGQSSCPRVCQCALLQEKETNELFRVINVHLDYGNPEVEAKEMAQIIAYLNEKNAVLDVPFFVLGDFNSEPESKAISLCNNSVAPKMVDLTDKIERTFHGFGKKTSDCKIDYIFADAKTAQIPHTVERWEESLNGIYLSDHYPVSVNLKQKGEKL